MKLSDQTTLPIAPDPGATSAVIAIAGECRHIDGRRAALDHVLQSLPEQAPEREEIWAELDALGDALLPAVGRLAATPCADANDLRHKAAVLAVLLRTGGGANLPEVSALALSVAEDVARVV